MSLFVRFSLFILALFWLIGIFILFFVPFLDTAFNFFPFFNLLSGRVCHQLPGKLITYHEVHSLVCARCSGIYAGGFAGSLYLLIFKRFNVSTKILLLSGIPLIADVLFYSTGLYRYSHYIAFFTGALFGTICFFYIFQGLNLLISELRSGK